LVISHLQDDNLCVSSTVTLSKFVYLGTFNTYSGSYSIHLVLTANEGQIIAENPARGKLKFILKILENPWKSKSSKYLNILWKSLKILWKSLEILWKSSENPLKILEFLLKILDFFFKSSKIFRNPQKLTLEYPLKSSKYFHL